MTLDARQWINDLGPDLAVQARLLHDLLTAVEAVAVANAALATATLLHLAGGHARPDLDTPLREYVTARLHRHLEA